METQSLESLYTGSLSAAGPWTGAARYAETLESVSKGQNVTLESVLGLRDSILPPALKWQFLSPQQTVAAVIVNRAWRLVVSRSTRFA